MMDSAKAFDAIAETYDQWYESPDGKIIFTMEVNALRHLAQDIKKPCLEVGVGSGRFALELGIEFGVDPSQAALKIAARRSISVARAQGEQLPFANATFGAVFLLFTICFVRNPEQVFSEAKRVLQQGGALIVAMINRESPWGQLYRQKKAAGHPIYQHANFYSIDEVAQMMRKTDLQPMAFASTLCQLPSSLVHPEPFHKELVEKAGVVAILGKLP